MKLESKNVKISISRLRRAFSVFVVIAILTASITVAYADDPEYTFEDENQPIPVAEYQSGTPFSESKPYIIFLGYRVTYLCASEPDIYCFRNGGNIVTVSATENSWIHYWWNQENPSNYSNPQHSDATPYDSGIYAETIQYDSANQVYYMVHDGLADSGFVPNYDNLSDGLAAFADFIENGGGSPTPSPSPTPVTTELNYSLPAGNVAYIQFNSEFDSFTLKSVMPVSSYVIGGSPWPQSNQYYGFASQIPDGGFTPPSTKISWEKNGSTTLVGITKNAIFEYGPHHPTSGNYLVVYNPAYYGGTDNGPYEFLNNGSITITAENVVSITVLQLESLLSPGENGVIDVETSTTGVVYEAEVDEETGEVIWENDNPPTTGGGNLPVSSESGFKSFLSTLVQKIVDVFEPAHDAIQTIASAISNFAQWMRALYIWLPAPILNLLTAAISLAIIIGVVKVFI